MAATNPIDPDPQAKTSDDIEAQKLLRRQAARSSRAGVPKTKSNGNTSVGGKSVSGGARARGGSF